MSQQDQDAIIGRVVRERLEVAKSISMLTVQAAKYGAYLKALGANLERSPERVALMGQSSGVESMDDVKWIEAASFPQLSDIVSIGNDLRALIEKKKMLNDQAVSLGI